MPMVSRPKTKPTRGKKKSIELSTGFVLRSSVFENLMGRMLKYENANFKPR